MPVSTVGCPIAFSYLYGFDGPFDAMDQNLVPGTTVECTDPVPKLLKKSPDFPRTCP